MTDKRQRVAKAIRDKSKSSTDCLYAITTSVYVTDQPAMYGLPIEELADAAIAAMNQPDEPEVPAVLTEMAKAIYKSYRGTEGEPVPEQSEALARAALRVIIQKIGENSQRSANRNISPKGDRLVSALLDLSIKEIDDLMRDGAAEGGEV